MSIQYLCTICTEAFELGSDISAIPCGHTFHEHCLQRWLAESMTCPQCRTQCVHRSIIKKLYFNQADESIRIEDSGKIRNDLENAKLALKQKDREKVELLAEQSNLLKRVEEMRENYRSMESLYQEERASNHSLRRELKCHQALQKDAEAARDEAKELRQKLLLLQNVANVINGCDEEIQTMVSDHANDAKQLATWCAVIQRELQTKREDYRTLRESHEKLKRETTAKQRVLQERTDELAAAREQIRLLEDDLRSSESQVTSLKNKVECLEKALNSPSDSRTMSLAKRLLNESPAPDLLCKRPRITDTPKQHLSPLSLPETPEYCPQRQSNVANNQQSIADKTKCIQIKTVGALKAIDQNSAPAQSRGINATYNLQHLNLFKRKQGLPTGSLLAKTDYNGLGGYEKHITSMKRSQKTVTSNRSTKVKGLVNNNRLFNPPLPKLDNFITLD